jgi:dienelactone hydrolase
MKRALLLVVAACGSTAPAQTQTQTQTHAATSASVTQTTEATPMSDEARARKFIDQLAKHDFASATATFDEKMLAGLPKDKLEKVWSQVETQAGELKSVDAIDMKEAEGMHIALAKVSFAKAPLVLRVVFDAQHRIAGFFMTPGDSAGSWTPPSYATPATFEEKPIAVGSNPALPGILTLPKDAKNVPAVVLVHGSGPNDQDETIGALKVFRDLAWGLASRGIAVLRYDKRTRVAPVGVTTQKEEVDDAAHAAIALLAARPEVDPKRVALLGHSQGGYLAPRIAKADPAIKRLVVFAGSTIPLEDSIVAQTKYMMTLSPNNAGLADQLKVAEAFKAAVNNPSLKPTDPLSVLGAPIPGSYMLDVRGYHPDAIAAQLTIPILVLQGEGDYQVTMTGDFPAWKKSLGTKKNATLKTYPGLSHAFTPAGNPPSPVDYMKAEHVDAKVIEDLAAFLSHP